MYNAGFVVNVVHSGEIVEDKNGVAAIPFNSEYKLRLKNKTHRKAVASIYIDGEKVTKIGDLIVGSGETVEVERFIDDTQSGRKFKFVSLDKSDDKSDKSFGKIEVKFRLEKQYKITISYPSYPNITYTQPWSAPQWTNTAYYSSSGSVGNVSYSASNSAHEGEMCSCSNISNVTDGKTVKGSYSGQAFNYATTGELEYEETVISLKLVGFDAGIKGCSEILYCVKCGKAAGDYNNFCGHCGNKINK